MTDTTSPRGKLYLVPTALDHGCNDITPLEDVLPLRTLKIAAAMTHWIVENAKSARAFLKRVDALVPLAHPIQSTQMMELPREVHKKGDHVGATRFDARPLLGPALLGHDVGLLSEAGMPAVADPGSSVVGSAHELGIEVVPLVGPSSILLALAASGLNGQNFAFVGYLPQDVAERRMRIQRLEQLASKTGQTQLFMEVPYRNHSLLQTLLQVLDDRTPLAIGRAITLPQNVFLSMRVGQWKRSEAASSDGQWSYPVVFGIGAR